MMNALTHMLLQTQPFSVSSRTVWETLMSTLVSVAGYSPQIICESDTLQSHGVCRFIFGFYCAIPTEIIRVLWLHKMPSLCPHN